MLSLIYRWHLLVGLLVSPVLLVVSITGAIFAFAPQLQRVVDEGMMHPACELCERLPYQQLFEQVATKFPGKKLTAVAVEGPGYSVQFSYFDNDGMSLIFVDPHSGEVLAHRKSPGGAMAPVLELHSSLFGGLPGRLLVELSTGWLLITVWLGLLLWWPNRKKLGGGWLPRFSNTGRSFWRDIHAVVGFWLIPLCLLFVLTGSFFTMVAGKTMLAATFELGGALSARSAGPDVEFLADSPRLSVDVFIEQHNVQSGSDQFFLLLPFSPNGNVQVSNDMGRHSWLFSKTWFHPQTGEVLQQISWSQLDFTSKVFGLMYPLHTGKVAGLPTQIIAAVGSLLISMLSLSGLWIWWKRRKAGRLSLPEKPSQGMPRWWLVWLLPLLLFAPLAVASIGALAIFSVIFYRLRPRDS
jgi:uncharacterized iron-regulated membrane protein